MPGAGLRDRNIRSVVFVDEMTLELKGSKGNSMSRVLTMSIVFTSKDKGISTKVGKDCREVKS